MSLANLPERMKRVQQAIMSPDGWSMADLAVWYEAVAMVRMAASLENELASLYEDRPAQLYSEDYGPVDWYDDMVNWHFRLETVVSDWLGR